MAGTDTRRAVTADSAAPVIVLVEPQLPENIGAAARAMMNFGLSEMRLVRPMKKWPHPKAFEMSSGAEAILERAQLFESSAAALADIQHIFATTARTRDMVKPVLTPRSLAGAVRTLAADGGRAAILFGRERTGLENDDIVRAEKLVTIPANPAHASLNLAQAILLIGYEWFLTGAPAPTGDAVRKGARPANHEELDGFFAQLEGALDHCGFLRVAEKRPRMVRNIRNIFTRPGLTDQEVRTLRGIVSCLVEGPRRDS